MEGTSFGACTFAVFRAACWDADADGWWWREYLKELSSVEILCDWVVF